jgi:ABC-type sugar transport system substrate-binding protein
MSGKLAATVQQKSELIGKLGVDAAKRLTDGEPLRKSIPVPLALVSQVELTVTWKAARNRSRGATILNPCPLARAFVGAVIGSIAM